MEIVLIISIAITVIALIFACADVIPNCIKEHHEYLAEMTKEDNQIRTEVIRLEQEKERTKQAEERTKVVEMEHEHWKKRMEGKY